MDTQLVAQQYRLQKWAKLIAERSARGLTIQAFCQEHGISRNAYFYWLKRVRTAACQALPQEDSVVFASLSLPVPATSIATNGKLTLHYGSFSLDVYESTPAYLLENTLSILSRSNSL